MRSWKTSIKNTVNPHARKTSRGQTAIGSQFGIVILMLILLGVLSIGYTYTATPAIDATSSVTESAALASYLTSSELSTSAATTATAGGPRLSPTESRDFFISGSTSGVADHWVGTSGINWNATVQNAQNESKTVLGEPRLEAGSDAPIYASEYERPAILNGDVVIVRVRTWE